MKGFSIIIPTLNRTAFLLDTLKDLVVQHFEHPFEIVIVDQSEEKDQEVLTYINDFDFIKYHHITSFKGLPEARNYGATMAMYEYLLYLDDDIRCGSDLLTQHFIFLDAKEISMVAGGITEKFKTNTESEIGKFVSLTANPLRGFHLEGQKEVDHAGGGNFSVKKSIYTQVGGIDEQLTKGAALYEETDFCLRLKKAGHTIFYNHKAHMTHLAAETGGCRVLDIRKYIYSLSRNRTIVIHRHLPWHHKITAGLYLIKLIVSYTIAYKDLSIFKSYYNGKKEGKEVAKQPSLRTV
ncbi:glycosyltransferase [uncultured Dokdonia sp.]|uniref:glycosyltransferase family 2 protein n=1 Tax=uncultured Dokdonia sp. TaxID=575653 RepID=UPI00262841BD|nr:glycosyltransferase [uncultured Dokdonia sp.]